MQFYLYKYEEINTLSQYQSESEAFSRGLYPKRLKTVNAYIHTPTAQSTMEQLLLGVLLRDTSTLS